MKLSEREVTFIYNYLNSSYATSYSSLFGFPEERKKSLHSSGTQELKVTELKAIGIFINRTNPFTNLGLSDPKLTRPNIAASKSQFLSYLNNALAHLRKCPQDWENLERKVTPKPSTSPSNPMSKQHTSTPPQKISGSIQKPLPSPIAPAIIAISSNSQTANAKSNIAKEIPAVAVSSSLTSPSPIKTIAKRSQLTMCVESDASSNTATTTTTTSSLSQSTKSEPLVQIETIKGIECINIIQYPSGNLPPNLIAEYQCRSHYQGYPSKLRYEEVKIKQEKKDKPYTYPSGVGSTAVASSFRPPPPPPDAPRNPTEVLIINSLRQMGFTDMQEMMGGLRHVQEQMGTNNSDGMVGGGGSPMEVMVDAIMMFIVTQREEKEEARKMDEARRHSEVMMLQDRLRREESHVDDDDDIVMISYDDILCTTGSSAYFPNSDLLRAQKTVRVFRALLKKKDDVQGMIRKLLTLESKSRKWYGKIIPVPYFRHILTEKIESMGDASVRADGSISNGDRSNIVRFLQLEIDTLEKGMYTLSEQMETDLGMKFPKIFFQAEETVKTKGLIVSQERDVIMLDDD